MIDKQYWILKQDDQKIGNILASNDGYRVTMYNTVTDYKTIPMLRKKANIEFADLNTKSKPLNSNVHGYDTSCRAYNGIWNVQMKMPLFTKQPKSKSWFAAGWYLVKQHKTWKFIRDPKLIVLERYSYQGPFHTREEANESIS